MSVVEALALTGRALLGGLAIAGVGVALAAAVWWLFSPARRP